jgi:signal peptidase I
MQSRIARPSFTWQGLLALLLVILLVRASVVDWNYVPSRSMAPTILPGDRILVDKLAFAVTLPFSNQALLRWATPQRWDIVTFRAPTTGVLMVKRVVGLPGDTVSWQSGRLRINDQQADYAAIPAEDWSSAWAQALHGQNLFRETLGKHSAYILRDPQPSDTVSGSFSATLVPQGHYLVMGDNRDNSGDFRVFGFVSETAITGKAYRVLFSLDPQHYYLPRWRFGTRL